MDKILDYLKPNSKKPSEKAPDIAQDSHKLYAFLDLIAYAEIGTQLLELSDNGYNVCVGSTPTKPILFHDYSKHPRIRYPALHSDAAGRYQFMGRYWNDYQYSLKLPDFGPESQDKWAIQLIRECKALDAIDVGDIEKAVVLCKSRWASFPCSPYGQPQKKMKKLIAAYDRSLNLRTNVA